MNMVQNDRGEMVAAVGAPGSLARIECTYPNLISRIKGKGHIKIREEGYKAGLRGVEIDNLVRLCE